MKRVLIIVSSSFVPWGGLTTVAMNYFRAMDKEGLIIDFASSNNPPQSLLDELKNCGSRYIKLPERGHVFRYQFKLYKVLKKYQVVHIHGNSATMALELFPAVIRKIPNRIVHCHTTHPGAIKLNKICSLVFKRMYTSAIACSEESGNWIFGERKFLVLNNAIDVKKYEFIEENRKKIRDKYEILEGDILVGNISKINNQKNHPFIVDIFYEMLKLSANVRLILVGDGPLRSNVEQKVKQLGLAPKVIFIGMSECSEIYLSAMDYFLLPSLWEGLPLSLVEAQANGLKCFASDVVTKQSNVTGRVEYISLKTEPERWANIILSSCKTRLPSEEIRKAFLKNRMDIKHVSYVLSEIYKK